MLFNSEADIHSVTGGISAEKLGHIQCHEHIYLRKGPSYDCNPALCMDNYELSLQELSDYRAAGGGTIVDAQPNWFGRDAKQLRRLSLESKVNILSVTGFHKLMFEEPSSPLAQMSETALAAYFADEVTKGLCLPQGGRIQGRAAFIKIVFEPAAFSHPRYPALLRAAARASVETCAPIMVHTERDTDVLELLAFLRDRGVQGSRVMVCHLDRTHYDAFYHRRVLQTGSTLCYDSINRTKYLSHRQELELISTMCNWGFEHQIVLSLDTTNRRLHSYGAQGMGLSYILTTYIPMLRSYGIRQDQIDNMCRWNGMKFLAASVR